MPEPEHEEIEREIRRLREQGDAAGAATLALRGYGAELFGFLVAFHRDEEDAAEVFSILSERLWRDLPGYRGECSFRTWAYTLARHASVNYRRDARRLEKRQRPLPEGSELSVIVEQVRSETRPYLRTEPKDRMRALRESLAPEDQALLILRVDRNLAWNDLAEVLHQGGDPLDEDGRRREAARLRKRFQLVKERLYEMGRREGLFDDGGRPR
jgi:RNA polymerase sigma-70 factor (ECF subfamily)